ncbi:MAG: polymerase, sigma-24 subunit, subfamily [Verrucomicrobiales bacterium]|nr:polymerase, sigma-24 subunit, subfamily [Verrucomicrobiales bacterium]
MEPGTVSPLPANLPDPADACLRRFQVSRDAFAFREIVNRYGGLVEGTARRLLADDTESARDVAQRVFTDLAKAAPSLAPDSRLGGWLHRHTVFLALHHREAETRRRRREREAAARWELDQPACETDADFAATIHAALTKLPADDRAALILRYWENHSLTEIGDAAGISADAAQKRVSRALEKLRARLGPRAATWGAALIAAHLAAPADAAAAPAWSAEVASTALRNANLAATRTTAAAAGWKAALCGAGVAAALCTAAFLPRLIRQEKEIQQTRAALAATPPLTNQAAPPPQATVPPAAALEKRVRDLEARLQAKSSREQAVESNLKLARERADRDRQSLAADDLTELEGAYQLARQQPDTLRHTAVLKSLIEKFPTSNRAGCAILRLARLSSGLERSRWLQEAIDRHSDTYYLDGTSVGAMARLQLAAEWSHAGRHADAQRLRLEIEEQFPDATDHDGLPILEALRTSTPPD